MLEKLSQITSQIKPLKWSLQERILLGTVTILALIIPFWGVQILWSDDLNVISVVVVLVFLTALGLPFILWIVHKSIIRSIFAVLNFGVILFMFYLSLEGFSNLLVTQIGTTINADISEVYKKTGGKPSERYFVEYRFTSEENMYERTQEISGEKYLAIQTNDNISIKYMRFLPSISATRDDEFARVQIGVFIAICLFFEFLLYSVLRKNEITNPVLAQVI